jgi:hypothetical protein
MRNPNMWKTAWRALLTLATAATPCAPATAQTTDCRWELTLDGRQYSGTSYRAPIIGPNGLCPGNVAEINSERFWLASINCTGLRNDPRTSNEFTAVLASVREHAREFPPVCELSEKSPYAPAEAFKGRATNFHVLSPDESASGAQPLFH